MTSDTSPRPVSPLRARMIEDMTVRGFNEHTPAIMSATCDHSRDGLLLLEQRLVIAAKFCSVMISAIIKLRVVSARRTKTAGGVHE